MKHQPVVDRIVELWNASRTVLLTAASNFDGDALGCVLALADLAVSQGKDVVIANEKPLSSLYGFLGVAHRVVTAVPDKPYDLIVICDTGSFDMLGRIYTENAELFARTTTVNIDHHCSCYGDVCWSTCSYENTSATMMVSRFIDHIDRTAMTQEMATVLLLGLYYDTECFRNANTTPHGLRFAADMIERGAQHDRLIRNLYQSTDPRYVALYGEVLAGLRPVASGTGMVGVVTAGMLERHEISADCLGNELVNDYLRSVRAKFVVLVKEIPGGGCRMSFRSKDEDYDMRELAAIFNGGGHKMATGAVTLLDTEAVVEKIEAFFRK